MKLKFPPKDITQHLCQWLDMTDVLTLIFSHRCFNTLLTIPKIWRERAKQFGIYHPAFELLDGPAIRDRLIAHMRIIYKEVQTVCPPKRAKLLASILIEDDANELELSILQTARESATTLMPIAIQFGRIEIMHSLFTHFKILETDQWLLLAIHKENYNAVKYLVEVKQIPLISSEPSKLFYTANNHWDSTHPFFSQAAVRIPGEFRHFNELLLQEILRCRHPKIIRYLKSKLHEQLDNVGIEHPERKLFKLLNRHSLENIHLSDDCNSPNLGHF